MNGRFRISGFADEINPALDRQIAVLQSLGMRWLSLRGVDGRNINDVSYRQFCEDIWPRLRDAGIGISSIGSPIGKTALANERAWEEQAGELEFLCRMANVSGTRFIRVFSFYLSEEERGRAELCYPIVHTRFRRFVSIARTYDITLLHENEKGIFGDTAARCRQLIDGFEPEVVGAAFDFANFVQVGEDPLAAWDLLRDRVYYIHVKDALPSGENVVCGSGAGQIERILREAVAIDYRGFLTLEPHLADFTGFAELEQSGATLDSQFHGEDAGTRGFAAQLAALRAMLARIGEGEDV